MAVDAVLIDGPADRRRMAVEEKQDMIKIAETSEIRLSWVSEHIPSEMNIKYHKYFYLGSTQNGTRIYGWDKNGTKIFKARELGFD